MTLRVTGGETRGRRLVVPRGLRPTEGLVREAIVNMVAAAVPQAMVLDLFAGSGALGVEALSRGAARVCFVDRAEDALVAIRRNLEAAGYQDRYWSAAMAALERIGLPDDHRERLRRFAESFVKRAA